MSGLVAGGGEGDAAEEVEHQEERGVVEDGAHGPDEVHEPPDVADVPFPRHRGELRVHAVGRDPDLGHVVEHVVREDLDGEHGQEGQEEAAAHDAEHVAEVGARPHADVLDDVSEDLAALDDAVVQHEEALLQQDDVRRLLGHVHGGVHGDPDVRLLEGRGVVDAVPHEPDDVPLALQGLDDLLLLRGRQAREDGGLLRGLHELLRREPLELGPGHQVLHVDAHVLADLAGDKVVVPGEDLHGDPRVLQGLQGLRRGFLGRIEEGDVAEEDHVALIRGGEHRLVPRELPVGDGQHPVAVRAQRLVVLQHVLADHVDQGEDVVLHLVGGAGHWKVLNSSDYGVLQTRKRIIIVGRKGKRPLVFPIIPTIANSWHVKKDLLHDPPLTPGQE